MRYKDNPKEYMRQYSAKHRDTNVRAARAWEAANPKLVKLGNQRRSFKHRFKNVKNAPTFEEYLKAIETPCNVCGIPMKEPCTDHDHKSMVFRNFICHACNRLLGCARDKIEILLSAVSYLKRYS